MNPVLVVLIILGGILIWFCCNSLFPVIGGVICGLLDETKFNINYKDEEEEEN